MPVFKAFFKVLNKRKASLLMYIIIYLVLTLFLSNVTQEKGQENFSQTTLDIAIENQDQGNLGTALTEYLGEHHNLQEVPQNKESLQDAMYYQRIDYVLRIPQDFTKKLIAQSAGSKPDLPAQGQGFTKEQIARNAVSKPDLPAQGQGFTEEQIIQNAASTDSAQKTGSEEPEPLLEGTIVPGSSSAYFMKNEIDHYLNTIAMYLAADYSIEEAAAQTAKDLSHSPQVDFLEKTDQQQLPGGYYFFQYIPYVFIILMILGIGAVMKTYKDKDLSARNKCSSMPFLSQNIQLLLGCLAYILVIYLAFLLMACMTDRAYMFSLKGLYSAANAFIFSLCALSIAWFSVQFVRNVSELNIMSNIFGLGFSFLGGVFVPMEYMGDTAKIIGKFTPSYWYVIANTEIQNLNTSVEAFSIYQSFFIVLMFAAAFFSAGLLVNKMKVRG